MSKPSTPDHFTCPNCGGKYYNKDVFTQHQSTCLGSAFRSAMVDILSTEFSNEFIEKMKNRMAVSYYKYGSIADAFPSRVDALASLDRRISEYLNTGNLEYLIDAANFLMIEGRGF